MRSGNAVAEGKHLGRCGNTAVIFRNLSRSCQLCGKTQGGSKKNALSEKKLVCRACVCHMVDENKKLS